MAISYDAFSSGGGAGAGPKTFSHTCTGSNLGLFVGIMIQDTGDAVSDVTYNGVTMNSVRNGNRSYLYYLQNPATGTNTVSVTYANSSGNGVSCVSQSYTGAGAVGATNSQSTTSGTQTLAVTTTVDNSWLVGFTGDFEDGGAFSAGTATTLRGSTNVGGSTDISGVDSNGAKTPTGSYSLQTTGNTAFQNRQIVVELTPYTAPAFTPSPMMHMMGITGGIM